MSSRAIPSNAIRPSSGRSETVHPLQYSGFAGPIRPDDSSQAALGDLAAQALYGRVPVISERQVLKLQSEGHCHPSVAVAQKNATQSAAKIKAAPSNL